MDVGKAVYIKCHDCIPNNIFDSMVAIEQYMIDGEKSWFHVKISKNKSELNEIKYCPFCGKELE